MALLARLIAAATGSLGLGPSGGAAPVADEAELAATALLVHVARADGVLGLAESERLARIVQGRYADSPEAARALIARAAAFDAETRDLSDLVELVGRQDAGGEGREQRARLVAMAWSVAGADGTVHEFEEALVWRLGALLGLDQAAIAAARETVPTAAA